MAMLSAGVELEFHLFNADDQYYAATILNWVRQGNPDIQIFGEAYYGLSKATITLTVGYNETEFTVRVPGECVRCCS